MQKKIIALAVAGLVSGVAFAQTSVTIYGVADAGFSSWSGDSGRWDTPVGVGGVAGPTVAPLGGTVTKGKSTNNTGVHSHGYDNSRLGFKGEENLGNGLKAIFQFESGVVLDGTSAWQSDRQSNVGLTGSFGTVKIGRQSSFSDAWHGGAGGNLGMSNLSPRNYLSGTNNARFNRFANVKADAISYLSPSFSGFEAGALVAFVDEGGQKTYTGACAAGNPAPGCNKWSDTKETIYQVGLRYMNGPFVVAGTAAMGKHDVYDSKKEYTLATSYDFGPVKVYGAWGRSANVDRTAITGYGIGTGMTAAEAGKYNGAVVANTATGNRKDTNDVYTLGASVPFGKNTVYLGYGETRMDAKSSDTKVYTLAYTYDFSKRTLLYAAYTNINNEKYGTALPAGQYRSSGATVIGAAPNSNAPLPGYYGADYNGIAVGLRHNF